MSKLEELIAKLCPNGVVYKTMDELGCFYGGLTGKSREDFIEGNAKFITYKNIYSNLSLNLEIDDRVKIESNEKQNTVQYGDVLFTGSSETIDECGFSSVLTTHTDEKLYLNSFCFGFRFFDKSLLLPGFLKYLFRSRELRNAIGKTASGVTRFNVSKKKMGKIKIPIPPLEVQEEIVRILDKFTELTAERTAELTAELPARKKQYEFYRDKLLKIGDHGEWFTISDIFEVKNGYTPSKKVALYWENGEVPWFRLEDIRTNGRVLSDSIQHISPLGVKKSGLIKKNSIMISTTATLGEHALVTTDYLSNQQITNITIKAHFENRLLPKFAFYYCFIIAKECFNIANYSGGIPIVDQSKFKRLLIPVPPLEEQRRIVEILDRFDKLCNDLTEGLLAEIEARKKQYEYYRDKLLTFKEISQ